MSDTNAERVELLAAALVARIEEVYRPEYVARIAQSEPNSLLGLAVRLRRALEVDITKQRDTHYTQLAGQSENIIVTPRPER